LRSLILFDIDGTLVRKAGPEHRHALIEAIKIVTGANTTTDGIPLHGMLDPDILTLMMLAAGLSEAVIETHLPEIFKAAEDIYDATVPQDLTAALCPGVPELLEKLKQNDTILALVTGNLTRIGWRKIERAGLRDYFRFGAFGEMAPTRTALARLAIEQARKEGLIDNNSPISLIGDAPQDVIAAQQNGIRSIAVRTGVTPPGELEACRPNCILDDLTFFQFSSVPLHSII
jgi:phosphoglycolate phosphatase-like HAD superfamily hydrolase